MSFNIGGYSAPTHIVKQYIFCNAVMHGVLKFNYQEVRGSVKGNSHEYHCTEITIPHSVCVCECDRQIDRQIDRRTDGQTDR